MRFTINMEKRKILNDTKWAKKKTEWKPGGENRQRGRPLSMWYNDIQKITEKGQNSIAWDRDKWNKLEDIISKDE